MLGTYKLPIHFGYYYQKVHVNRDSELTGLGKDEHKAMEMSLKYVQRTSHVSQLSLAFGSELSKSPGCYCSSPAFPSPLCPCRWHVLNVYCVLAIRVSHLILPIHLYYDHDSRVKGVKHREV